MPEGIWLLTKKGLPPEEGGGEGGGLRLRAGGLCTLKYEYGGNFLGVFEGGGGNRKKAKERLFHALLRKILSRSYEKP